MKDDRPLNSVSVHSAIVSWREAFPRPEWNDPAHWLATRPVYEDRRSA